MGGMELLRILHVGPPLSPRKHRVALTDPNRGRLLPCVAAGTASEADAHFKLTQFHTTLRL
jgi:hypothetical protein